MLCRLTTLFVLFFSLTAIADTAPFPGIKKLMTVDEYESTGLNKLTPAELDALNQWLINYTVVEAPVMRRDNEEVKAAEEAIEITANINKPFSGWSGKTVFYLDNGQVWQQRVSGRYHYSGENTGVVIDKNLLGFYKMTLIETGNSIGVTRVK